MSAAVVKPVAIGGRTWRLTFKFGTIRIFERELGKPLAEAFPKGEDAAPVALDTLSALFWASLQPAHRLTRDAADDLVDEAGIEAVGGWIGEGLSAYFAGPARPAEDAGSGELAEGNGTLGSPPAS